MPDQPSGSRPGTEPGTPPLGRYYQVADRRLLLHRSGRGEPAVVFLAGAARSAWTT